LVSKGDADLVVADAAFAEKIQNSPRLPTKLVPILRELEATNDASVTVPFRYALAVIKSGIAGEFQGNLSPLKSKRSCHGSIKSLAGWNAPLSVLRDAGEISGENCALPVELSKYFAKICLPGAPDAKKRQPDLPHEALCSLCAGDADATSSGKALTPETVCADNPTERYQGSAGALRCLTDDVADVAFMDHVALLQRQNTPTKIRFDVKLLCRNGTVTEIDNFRACHWGMIPSQKILARGGDDDRILRENARLSLLRAQDQFRPGGKDERILKLFGVYYGTNNIIFQDTSVGLQNELKEEETLQENKIIKDFNYCKVEGHHHPHGTARDLNDWSPKEQI